MFHFQFRSKHGFTDEEEFVRIMYRLLSSSLISVLLFVVPKRHNYSI